MNIVAHSGNCRWSPPSTVMVYKGLVVERSKLILLFSTVMLMVSSIQLLVYIRVSHFQ